jgi:hypothetical protein
MDAGMVMPAAADLMLMPSYGQTQSIGCFLASNL